MPTPSYQDIVEQAPSLGPTVTAARRAADGLRAEHPWVFVGCGASYHAGAAAAGLMTVLSGAAAVAVPASDLWMNPEIWVRPGTTVVGLSRTGTTTETAAALDVADRAGATTVGISLTPGTEVVAGRDVAVVLDHVAEQGRVMTRSFANLLLAAQTLVVQATLATGGGVDPSTTATYDTALDAVSPSVGAAMDDHDAVAQRVAKTASGHLVFLASGPDIGLARQAALQTQETARPAVEAHHVLDYRHGPMATLTSDSVLAVISNDRSVSADLVLAEDVRVLGGTLVAVGPAGVVERFPAHVERVATVGGLPRWLGGNTALPFLQALAYHLTVARGADPESVRNLDRTKQPHVNPHILPAGLFDGSAP